MHMSSPALPNKDMTFSYTALAVLRSCFCFCRIFYSELIKDSLVLKKAK